MLDGLCCYFECTASINILIIVLTQQYLTHLKQHVYIYKKIDESTDSTVLLYKNTRHSSESTL